MLDVETRRRIDTARDILVGKVPDPKSQVEQITIALIYKFMWDIEARSEELGGQRSFFVGDFERYAWPKLLRSGLGGFETLSLYAEALDRIPENPGIPPLFRSIFNNAYLPYRDPETLREFLKVIDQFEYDHSERLGDAFEYLLSIMGAQGDARQFRTPRHIIDFIVEIVNPQLYETVLDPACGTAGFLISAYKHIQRANTDADGQSTLTPHERGRLAESFTGYDISPDMVRLSLVNMYLHGFVKPDIHEYDTLTSEERWDEYADVILANPPFMSPKGGIRPHNRFSVQARRSEVLFVDYMAEHLTPEGRAGIIVPEGVIFQSQKAHTQLRKMLVEDYLVAVVSLPAGVFKPYSGVKTSILILDRALARHTDHIAFFKVENDGFDLGHQRRPIDRNDLPQVRGELTEYLRCAFAGESLDAFQPSLGLIVEKGRIAKDGDYSLSCERYREVLTSKSSYPLIPIGRFYRKRVKSTDPRLTPDETYELWSIPAFGKGRPEVLKGSEIGSPKKIVYPGDVLLSRIVPHIRRSWIVKNSQSQFKQVASTEWIVLNSDEIVPEYLRSIVISDAFHQQFMQTITGVGGSLSRANPKAVADIRVPVPPLEVQQEIVAEIESYQKVIDGARAVIDNYRPHIPIDPDWPLVRLGEVCKFKRGPFGGSLKKEVFVSEGHAVYEQRHAISANFDHFRYFIDEEKVLEMRGFEVHPGDLIMSCSGTMGRTAIVPDGAPSGIINQALLKLTVKDEVLAQFLKPWMDSYSFQQSIENAAFGAAIRNVASVRVLKSLEIPLPTLEIQRSIISEIEIEQAAIDANRELLRRFEQKTLASIGRVWSDNANGKGA